VTRTDGDGRSHADAQALASPRRSCSPMPDARGLGVCAALPRRLALHGLDGRSRTRLARHRAGVASRYTASRLPVELELVMPMARAAARREEARIKRLPQAAKLALLGADEVTRTTHGWLDLPAP
jgi:predicted GIY-YIG superfamily endonuclease